MFGWFKKRLDTPIERRNYGKLYAGLSLLLFLGTLWAVSDEVTSRRPWKDFQEEFKEVKTRVLKFKLREVSQEVSKDALKAALKDVAKIEHEMQGAKFQAAQKKVDDINITIRDLSQERANLKAVADNRNYLFEHNRKEGHPEEAEKYRKEREDLFTEMAGYDRQIDSLTALRSKIQTEDIKSLTDRRKAAVDKRDSIFKQVADLRTAIDKTNDEPIKIKQVMLPDFDKSNFGRMQMRVDRCQSCHLGIGDPIMADTNIYTKVGKGQVFRTAEQAERARKVFGPHPNPELLSKHGIERFGCTSCHGGQASSVDDVEHAHGFQAHWTRPLLVGEYVQTACAKCHVGSYNFASMDRIAEGRKLFIDFGCFGCHEAPEIPDWQTYKVGPSLTSISRKITPEWAFKWIQNPTSWNEHTRMPNFKFDAEQTEAVVAYLFNASANSTYRPASESVPAGDPARGLATMKSVGCIACHAVADMEGRGKYSFVSNDAKGALWPNAARDGNRVAEGNMFGPDLNKVGSKVSAAWLYDWVRDPKHYMPTTRMPSLRLSSQEAADITSYLMTRQDPTFTAGVTLSHLNDPATIDKGKKLIREYGCFGCHRIDGMENEGKVSVALADFGKKTSADLFFGYIGFDQLMKTRRHFDSAGYKLGHVYEHVNVGEDWFVWAALKMKNPRVFATDAIPQKMPVFNMTDEEAFSLTVLLRSFTKEYIPEEFTRPMGTYQAAVDDGRFLTHWRNCVGCHKIEEHGGHVQELLRVTMDKKGDDILPYAPPSLNTAGLKLQENWFYSFVHDPSSHPVRTWLDIRMPSYGFTPEEISRLDRYFLALEKRALGFTDYSFYPATDQTIAAGRILFERLKCQQCHAAGASPANGGATAVPAPNLALAGNRLNPEWIPRWVRDPQSIVPGSKMPNFFGTIDNQSSPFPDILNGDWKAQVNALRDYVWRIGGAKGLGPDSNPVPVQSVSDTSAASAASGKRASNGRGSGSTNNLSMR
jgi:mono/diheme cytochrome c family protein